MPFAVLFTGHFYSPEMLIKLHAAWETKLKRGNTCLRVVPSKTEQGFWSQWLESFESVLFTEDLFTACLGSFWLFSTQLNVYHDVMWYCSFLFFFINIFYYHIFNRFFTFLNRSLLKNSIFTHWSHHQSIDWSHFDKTNCSFLIP